MSYTKWQNNEPKPNDDSNDNSESQTNDAESSDDSNAGSSDSESNDNSNAESNDENNAESNDDSDGEAKAALCIVTDSEFKWITVECAKETKYYMCSRPLIPNCGRNGRCKMSNAFTLPIIN